METEYILKRIFKKVKALKKDNEDAECSECRNGVEDTKHWYQFGGQNWGGVQLCDDCMQSLKNKLLNR